MNVRPTPPPPPPEPGLPAVRRPAPAVRAETGADDARDPSGSPAPGARPSRGDGPRRWPRSTRTPRGAAGLAVVAAALLLWPFAGFFWFPWLAGLAVLVLVALLRLDRLLHGWSWHVGGAVVVVGLMLRTGPWDWALAASLGVLLAGLARLPRWRLAAVGAVLCVLSGVGWGFDRYRVAQEAAAQQAQRSRDSVSLLGERTPERVLPALLEGIGQGDATGVCGLLAPQARTAFVQAAGAADCRAAVEHFHAALPQVPPLRDLDAPLLGTGAGAADAVTVDGCRTVWGSGRLGGAALGVLDVARTPPPGRTWFVSGFRSCPSRSG